ncbi:amidohydrolase family protein [Pleionea sediminis]|uniref:amidohydrolase family protein n=1 Tax=Pleionea sediminis TaxID=2569479 RepID=UPI0011859B26|nr:amidohydrolase family protein [Pleionea sediminis]
MRINGHGHLLPKPSQIPAFMREKKYFWIDDDCQFMHQGNWKRPITDPSFFLERKLEWMAENNIAHEVVLTLSQLYCNGLAESETSDILCFQNDFNAEVQRQHPNEFTTGFVVQPAHLDLALKEMKRCVKELNMKMLCLSTHYQNHSGEWVSVADESVAPIWQLANEMNLALEIHPYDAGKMVNLKDKFWRNHLVWMMAQTADTYLMFTLNGFASKYPNVRTCFAHGNMLGLANHGRVIQGVEGRPDLFPGVHHPNETKGQPNVFFDTLVHDIHTLELMLNRCGASQMVWGVDDPYPLGEMDTVEGCYPGIFLDEAEKSGVLTSDDKQKIMNSNVQRWLGIDL